MMKAGTYEIEKQPIQKKVSKYKINEYQFALI